MADTLDRKKILQRSSKLRKFIQQTSLAHLCRLAGPNEVAGLAQLVVFAPQMCWRLHLQTFAIIKQSSKASRTCIDDRHLAKMIVGWTAVSLQCISSSCPLCSLSISSSRFAGSCSVFLSSSHPRAWFALPSCHWLVSWFFSFFFALHADDPPSFPLPASLIFLCYRCQWHLPLMIPLANLQSVSCSSLPPVPASLTAGKGIYFADCPLKSWRYCFATKALSQSIPKVLGRGGLILGTWVELGKVREERQVGRTCSSCPISPG